jgi:hypothetical protein
MGGGPGAEPQESKEAVEAEKREKEEGSFYELAGIDLVDIAWPLIILSAVGFLYTGTLTFGAVQVQHLESRGWGMAAAIMVIVPLSTFGLQLFLSLLANVPLMLILDDFGVYLLSISGILWAAAVGIGIYNLIALNKEEVIAGFEYEPE